MQTQGAFEMLSNGSGGWLPMPAAINTLCTTYQRMRSPADGPICDPHTFDGEGTDVSRQCLGIILIIRDGDFFSRLP
jgi:hypothetical protein